MEAFAFVEFMGRKKMRCGAEEYLRHAAILRPIQSRPQQGRRNALIPAAPVLRHEHLTEGVLCVADILQRDRAYDLLALQRDPEVAVSGFIKAADIRKVGLVFGGNAHPVFPALDVQDQVQNALAEFIFVFGDHRILTIF